MNVLSLFDGMSCGQIALERAGIMVENYFASEIDKYAIKITQKNYPDTIQLGDVTNWIDWHLPKIDLLIGGSPCQGFSNAGHGLNFDDPRSKLFFKFVDCLKWYKPTYFLLENVRMKKEWQLVINEYLGVEPIRINSALVSAQNRDRFYWTNIPNITQPEDKGILLKDVIKDNVLGAAIRNQVTKRGVEEQLNIRKDDKSNCVVPSYPHKLNGCVPYYVNKNHAGHLKSYYQKAGCLTGGAHSGGNHSDMTLIMDNFGYRRLTEAECERLQTVPDNYTEGVSNTQRYKMLGNGWTVDVIAHIFSFIPKE